MDCTPPGSSVHGILQARILEWIAMSFSRDLNLGLLRCRQVCCCCFYHLGYQGIPLICPIALLKPLHDFQLVKRTYEALHKLVLLTSFSHQFSSVAQSCPTLFDPMDYSMPGLPVHHQLPEFT